MATFIPIDGKKGTMIKAIVRIKGYKTKCKSFANISQAKKWAKEIEVAMENGSFSEVKKNSSLKYVSDLILYFKENVAPSRYKNHASKYNCMFDWWIDKIGHIKLEELSASDLANCKQLLLSEKCNTGKQRKPNTINKYLMCISTILTFAVDELEVINFNPKSKVKCVPKPEGRKRFLTLEELSMFLNACKQDSDIAYLFVLISLGTGGRYSEVQTLKVENIDFENQRVYYINTKNHTSRGVYLEQKVFDFLKKYLKENNITTGYIFSGKRKDSLAFLRGKVYKIIKQIGLKDFTVHDMRHTFASYAAMNGASLLDISELLGHKSLTMSKRYSHLTQKHTDKIVQNFVGKII